MNSLGWLPSLLSLLNLVVGVTAIILSMEGSFYGAAVAVVVAMLFDGLDGWIARRLHTSSDFGGKLDSLADIISFGIAPAVILYGIGLKDLGILGWLAAILFPIAGAVRLARFKAISVNGYFEGLPITAAGGIAVSLVISRVDFAAWSLAIVVILLAILMVSRVRYPHLMRLNVRNIRIWKILLFIGVITIGIVITVTLADLRHLIFLPSIIYILYGIKDWVFSKTRIIKGKHGPAPKN